MTILLLYFFLLSAVLNGWGGRHFGHTGSSFLAPVLLGFTCLVAWWLGLNVLVWNEEVVFTFLGYCLQLGWSDYEITWALQFDGLTVMMCMVVTSISWLVHIYATSYMATDPHLSRFLACLSFFTFFMLVLVTADNYFQLFVALKDLIFDCISGLGGLRTVACDTAALMTEVPAKLSTQEALIKYFQSQNYPISIQELLIFTMKMDFFSDEGWTIVVNFLCLLSLLRATLWYGMNFYTLADLKVSYFTFLGAFLRRIFVLFCRYFFTIVFLTFGFFLIFLFIYLVDMYELLSVVQCKKANTATTLLNSILQWQTALVQLGANNSFWTAVNHLVKTGLVFVIEVLKYSDYHYNYTLVSLWGVFIMSGGVSFVLFLKFFWQGFFSLKPTKLLPSMKFFPSTSLVKEIPPVKEQQLVTRVFLGVLLVSVILGLGYVLVNWEVLVLKNFTDSFFLQPNVEEVSSVAVDPNRPYDLHPNARKKNPKGANYLLLAVLSGAIFLGAGGLVWCYKKGLGAVLSWFWTTAKHTPAQVAGSFFAQTPTVAFMPEIWSDCAFYSLLGLFVSLLATPVISRLQFWRERSKFTVVTNLEQPLSVWSQHVQKRAQATLPENSAADGSATSLPTIGPGADSSPTVKKPRSEWQDYTVDVFKEWLHKWGTAKLLVKASAFTGAVTYWIKKYFRR